MKRAFQKTERKSRKKTRNKRESRRAISKERERDRERERERERQRERERETDRQTETETDRQRQRQRQAETGVYLRRENNYRRKFSSPCNFEMKPLCLSWCSLLTAVCGVEVKVNQNRLLIGRFISMQLHVFQQKYDFFRRDRTRLSRFKTPFITK